MNIQYDVTKLCRGRTVAPVGEGGKGSCPEEGRGLHGNAHWCNKNESDNKEEVEQGRTMSQRIGLSNNHS